MNSEFDRIEQYLHGDLSTSERASFERELQEDERLRERLALHRLADEAGPLLVEDEIRERLDHIRSKSRVRSRFFSLGRLGIAASLLLVAAASVLFYAQLNYSEAALAETYRMAPLTTLQADRGASGSFKEAQSLIRSGQISAEAIALLDDLDPSDPNFLKGQYLLAHRFMKENQFDQALPRLERLMERSSEVASWADLQELDWNLAVCLLAVGREDRARKLFGEIARDSTHPQGERARALLRDLDSPWHALAWF